MIIVIVMFFFFVFWNHTAHCKHVCFLGMALALLLYMGHIPRLFARNLFYLQKTRFKVPKGDKGEKKKM